MKSLSYAVALADEIKFSLCAIYLDQVEVVHDLIQLASPDPLQRPLIHPHIELRHPEYYEEGYDGREYYRYEDFDNTTSKLM